MWKNQKLLKPINLNFNLSFLTLFFVIFFSCLLSPELSKAANTKAANNRFFVSYFRPVVLLLNLMVVTIAHKKNRECQVRREGGIVTNAGSIFIFFVLRDSLQYGKKWNVGNRRRSERQFGFIFLSFLFWHCLEVVISTFFCLFFSYQNPPPIMCGLASFFLSFFLFFFRIFFFIVCAYLLKFLFSLMLTNVREWEGV